ncbi:hypothetical protein [Sulfuriferula sp.]|uniref:hypothetical protein n=1 Tax=Sulfuriferula sp. TaxID=2025307 RepID=UPI0035212A40
MLTHEDAAGMTTAAYYAGFQSPAPTSSRMPFSPSSSKQKTQAKPSPRMGQQTKVTP